MSVEHVERIPDAEGLGAGLGSSEKGLAEFYSRAQGSCLPDRSNAEARRPVVTRVADYKRPRPFCEKRGSQANGRVHA